MSHGDQVKSCPDDFVVVAKTPTAPFAAIAHTSKPIYGIQFHAEVTHSLKGKEIIGKFVTNICKCKTDWTMVRVFPLRLCTCSQSLDLEKVKGDGGLRCQKSQT